MNDSPRDPIVPSNSVAILGSVVTCANVLVTIIIVALMIRDKYAASTAAISAVTFFIISTTTALLTLSGTLTAVITNAQDQHTARSLHSLQFHAPVAVELVQPLQLPHSPNVPAQLPSGDNYVAAVEHNDARKEALLWTMQLYGDDGLPNPRKVNLSAANEKPGRTWTKKPSPDAIRFLTERGVAHNLGNGIRLNLQHCPTITDARAKLK